MSGCTCPFTFNRQDLQGNEARNRLSSGGEQPAHVNLPPDPKYASRIRDMRARLQRWRVQQDQNLNKVPMPEDARRGEIPYPG
jgi:hypothetical protein